jgi:hypothetical protein
MSVESVRADIMDAVNRIKLEGCLPTMRSALLVWQQYLTETQPSGLSAADKEDYAAEHKRVQWLLTEVFPEGGE